MPASPPAPGPALADVDELERALTRIAYLITRARHNDLITSAAGVPLDRAAVVVLLQLADAGAMRPGELADRLEVEAPHITRQVRRLARAGYAERAPDPDDRRAQLVRLTPSGKAAARRIREVGRTGMQAALAHWSPQEVHQLTGLFHRMVDDFLAAAAEHERSQPAERRTARSPRPNGTNCSDTRARTDAGGSPLALTGGSEHVTNTVDSQRSLTGAVGSLRMPGPGAGDL